MNDKGTTSERASGEATTDGLSKSLSLSTEYGVAVYLLDYSAIRFCDCERECLVLELMKGWSSRDPFHSVCGPSQKLEGI